MAEITITERPPGGPTIAERREKAAASIRAHLLKPGHRDESSPPKFRRRTKTGLTKHYMDIGADWGAVDSFIHQAAALIADHQEKTDPREVDDLFDLSVVDHELEQIKKRLDYFNGPKKDPATGEKIYRILSDGAVTSAMNILRKDAQKRLARIRQDPGKDRGGIGSMFAIYPKGRVWVGEIEAKLIANLISLYGAHFSSQQTDDQRTYHVALIFHACRIWPNRSEGQSYEVLKKRLQDFSAPDDEADLGIVSDWDDDE